MGNGSRNMHSPLAPGKNPVKSVPACSSESPISVAMMGTILYSALRSVLIELCIHHSATQLRKQQHQSRHALTDGASARQHLSHDRPAHHRIHLVALRLRCHRGRPSCPHDDRRIVHTPRFVGLGVRAGRAGGRRQASVVVQRAANACSRACMRMQRHCLHVLHMHACYS